MAESMVDKNLIGLGKVIIARIEELQGECSEIRKKVSDAGGELLFLEKAEDKCKMCLLVLEKGQSSVTKQMLIKMVQQYSQAVLDATYVVECWLVNEDFPQDRSTKEIKYLIGRLNHPEQLVKEMFGSTSKLVEVLGTDVLECLYWRRGALLYMYCHTAFHDHDRRQLNAVYVLECTVSGVSYLESMLSVRAPLVLDDHKNVDVKDTDMVHLLTEGVFSDTHLLAIMYAGEMCYWHWKLANDRNTDLSSAQSTERNFDSLANGTKFLERFMDVVKTRFQGKGWDCSRAEQILAEFRAS